MGFGTTFGSLELATPAANIAALTDNGGGTADQTVASLAAAVTLTDSTGDSGTHDDTLADGVTIGAALTDNTTGSAGDTLAAGAGVDTLAFFINLAGIADGDLLTNYTVGYRFKLLSIGFLTETIATTGGKASTLNLEIGTTNVTGGTVALTTATVATKGVMVAGAAITANNVGTASDTLSIEAATTTTFGEGSGWILIRIQNMDTADAVASMTAKINSLRTDNGVQNQNTSDLAQKVIELVTWQAAVQNNVKEITTHVESIRDAMTTAGLMVAD